MSTTRTKTPYKLEVMSADGSQTGSVLNATITNAGVVDVDISGNLSVAGTTTYVETTNLKISDAIIELNKDNIVILPSMILTLTILTKSL